MSISSKYVGDNPRIMGRVKFYVSIYVSVSASNFQRDDIILSISRFDWAGADAR